MLRLSSNDETAIAPTLERLNADMHDLLAVGSYPVTDQVSSHLVMDLHFGMARHSALPQGFIMM